MTNINVDFILPFIEATQKTFQSMIFTEVDRKEVFIKKNYVMYGDISGIIGLSGDVTGTAAISLPGQVGVKTIGTMLGEDLDDINAITVHDGVGELINMIAGSAKTIHSNNQCKINITLPTIISGKSHEVYHKKGTISVVILLEMRNESADNFAIEICVPELD